MSALLQFSQGLLHTLSIHLRQSEGGKECEGGREKKREREMEFLLDDWSQEESWKMVDGAINETKCPRGVDLLHVAACIKLKSQPSCQQSYTSTSSMLYF